MFKKTLLILLAAALCIGTAACKGKQTEAQLNAEAEKKWRDQQGQKAVRYYKELAEKFPDTPQAAEAKERLRALGVPEGPATAQK
jgi:outer membrane protein assembly factor BamD (BamD/ComL family)